MSVREQPVVKRFFRWLVSGVAFGFGLLLVVYVAREAWPEDRYFSSSQLANMIRIDTLQISTLANQLTFEIELTNTSSEQIDELGLSVDLFSKEEVLVGSCYSVLRGISPDSTSWKQVVCDDQLAGDYPEWDETKVGALYAKRFAAH